MARRRICATCGDVAPATHACRAFSPARAAAAADIELPPGATLEDFTRLLVGAPGEVAQVLACLPAHRRERLYEQLQLSADQAHEAAA